MSNEKLTDQLKITLSTYVSFATKVQNYHWNVTGPNFIEYHKFFGDVYTDLQGRIDDLAELIRQCGTFVPGSLKRFGELTKISDELNIPSSKFMFIRLTGDVQVLFDEIVSARNIAATEKDYAAVSFLESELEFFSKLEWMLKSVSES